MPVIKPSTLGYTLAGLVMLIALCVGSTGCTSSPRVDFANAQDTYIAAVTTLATNRDSFTDQEWQEDIIPLVNAGDAALDQFEVLTANGLDAGSASSTLRQVLIALRPWLERLE